MIIPSPHTSSEFETIYEDKEGQPEYGERSVDGLTEIVHIPSGKSNMTYHKPEVVFDPTNCSHDFKIMDIGKREVECRHCYWNVTFHPNRNYKEENGQPFMELHGVWYKLSFH